MIKIEVKNINIEEILFSGACFRVIKENDGSITNILKDRVINLKQDKNIIYVKSSNYDNLENIIYDYFDLNRDYDYINKDIIKRNNSLKNIVNKCINYRILNQDPFEMGISYIISQSNNVKRISNIINNISNKYGKKIIFEDKEYHLFPTYDELKNITIEDLSEFKLGYRDKYIIDYIKNYKKINIDNSNDETAINVLTSINGIGLKVASCVLLFGYKRLNVFPIDTWVKKYMASNFNIKPNERDIKKYAIEHFSPYSGLIIQYLFHIERNKNNTTP